MPEPRDLWAYDQNGTRRQAWSFLQSADANARKAAQDSAAALAIVKEMAQMGRSLTVEEIETAAEAGAASGAVDPVDDQIDITDAAVEVTPQG